MQFRGFLSERKRLPKGAAFSFGALLIAVVGSPVAIRPVPVNPPIDSAKTIRAQMAIPAGIESMLRRACYDCHSDETGWPWYRCAEGALGDEFSEWTDHSGRNARRAAGMLVAACADLRSGRMPVKQYVWMHPEAKLGTSEVAEFCEWTQSLALAARKP